MCPLRPRLPSGTPCSHLCVSLSVRLVTQWPFPSGGLPCGGDRDAGGGRRWRERPPPDDISRACYIRRGALSGCRRLCPGGSLRRGQASGPQPGSQPARHCPLGRLWGPHAPFQLAQTVPAPPPSGLRDRSLVHPQPAPPRARPAHITQVVPAVPALCPQPRPRPQQLCLPHGPLLSSAPRCWSGPPSWPLGTAGTWATLRPPPLFALQDWGWAYKAGGALVPWVGRSQVPGHLEEGPRAEGCPGWGSPPSPG